MATQADSALDADPRLQPTPDYGRLGPGSDVARDEPDSLIRKANRTRPGPFLAIAAGVALALLVSLGRAHWVRPRLGTRFPARETSSRSTLDVTDARQLDRLKPQKQAEALLEHAIAHPDGAVEQISSRIDRWQGKLLWNSQIATLTTAALNSNDSRVRESGVEVELAAYGLAKNSASLDYLLKTSESSDHAQKIWALWALGLMGNRSVETARVVQVLTAHLKDSENDSRRWAVESLALVGTSETIPVLLTAMHDDPSPLVRERAACSLAQSGMLTHEQRWSAVPQLLTYTDDPALDTPTHTWAFLALSDITGQRLPNDSASWRRWYDSTKN